MINQIPVTIEGDGEDFTASFVEGNISASGETEADAIANFKESLLSTYEVLEGLTPQQRGPLPTRQWEILQNVVRRAD
jgi:predicted RNase H-like HicB family nuclease